MERLKLTHEHPDMRWYRRGWVILRHPLRWACGCCFICGDSMLFEAPYVPKIGNRYGFCCAHGFRGWFTDKPWAGEGQ